MNKRVVIITDTPLKAGSRAEQNFYKIIEEAKLKDFYITSIIKGDVRAGYKVTDEDLAKCASAMEQELDFKTGPSLYITMGPQACKLFVDLDNYLANNKKTWNQMINSVHLVMFQNKITGSKITHFHLPTIKMSGNKAVIETVKKALGFARMFEEKYEVITDGCQSEVIEARDLH